MVKLNEFETYMPEDKRSELTRLLDKFTEIYEDEDSWTWLDNDPDVAWMTDSHESYHGKLRELYLEAGWEGCYHDSFARFHFNVKLNGNDRYRGFNDRVREIELERPEIDTERLEEIAQSDEDFNLEIWWSDDLPDYLHYDLGKGQGARNLVYGCGRSGGYVQSTKELDRDPETMIRLAFWLAWQRESWNSYDAGKYRVDEALERYDEEKLEALASPRVDTLY
jgi:hypothetical protein